jgi:hypothetical protein
MNDYRAAAEELHGQFLAVARKGQRRVATTVKNVTAAAQQIRPQLANLPKPTLNLSALPGQTQIRDRASSLVAELPTRLPTRLQTKLPSADQLKAGAHELAGHARSVQRLFAGQVRSVTTPLADQVRGVATPLAHQAAERLAQVGVPAQKTETTTKVSHVSVTRGEKAAPAKAHAATSATASAHSDKAKSETAAAKDGGSAKTRTRPTSAGTRKPKAKSAGK